MSFLKVHQIYFEESQKAILEPNYIPYDNSSKCTIWFENTPIKDLIFEGAHLESEYWGVISYNLRNKLSQTKKWQEVFAKNHSVKDFSSTEFEQILLDQKPDVMSFCLHPAQDQVRVGEKYHPKFVVYWKYIMDQIGYPWVPEVWLWISYCQFHVAKSKIYERYVFEMLVPAMKVMEGMPELMEPSLYNKPYPERLQKETGVDHWTYHAFLCERMMSFFVHIHSLKGISY